MTAALAELARTAALTAGDDDAQLAAAGWALHGRAAIGEAIPGAIRALDALGQAPPAGDSATAGPLLLGLAAAAREIREHGAAWQLLRAVLDGVGTPDELRTDALIEAARLQLDRDDARLDELTDAARRATVGCGGPAEDIRLGMIDAVVATADRRSGRFARAADRARDALAALTSDHEPLPSAPHVAADLVLELVRALIDDDMYEEALDAARAALAWPERAGTVERLCWLRLAIAEPTNPPVVDEGSLVASLETAARSCAALEIPRVEAACHLRLAELYEAHGDLEQALAAVRGAHSAEQRYAAARERYRLQLAQSTGVLADPLSIPLRGWDADRDDWTRGRPGRDDLVPDDLVPGSPGPDEAGQDGAQLVEELDETEGEVPAATTPAEDVPDEDRSSPEPPEEPLELMTDVSVEPEPALDGGARDVEAPAGPSDTPAEFGGEVPADHGNPTADHHAKPVRWEQGSVVRITIASGTGPIPVDAVRRGLARLRPSIEARLPLEAKILTCDKDVVALLPWIERAEAENAMRGLCAELDELCPFLADELPGAVFHAEIAEHIGDTNRLERVVRDMSAADPAGAADSGAADATDLGGDLARPAQPGSTSPNGRHSQPGDTAPGADRQLPDAAADGETVVDLDKRQKRREPSFAELLAGALAAYREA
jgi:tetratricopeptide (TPR) repeat protein